MSPTLSATVERSRLLSMALMSTVLMLTAVGCHRLECADDEDCPEHWACVGSSLCPEDVLCIWEGEPGLCLPIGEEHLCAHTDGEWDESSCGHYECGAFPDCDAVIPGCNCGPDSVFVEKRGCVEDIACTGGCYSDEDCDEDYAENYVCHGARLYPEHPNPRFRPTPLLACMWDHDRPGECVVPELALCEKSGGRWDELACGDYDCGQPNACAAVIPGCDCGPGANYVADEGCTEDLVCPGVCLTGDDCEKGQFCKRPTEPHLGLESDVHISILPCPPELCGYGTCMDVDIPLCRRTGGNWDESRCGHSTCQSDFTCLAIIPGCDCGPRASWVEGDGCVEDPACKPPGPPIISAAPAP
ncbi:MAG: hypothetical protein JRG96_07165 [Deltaproteobacteria bacterium]|nr:hypothetical protein [Deltaproteobacteria bacterium]